MENLRPFPKAAPRVTTRPGRKRKTAILTDTPTKKRLEDEQMAALARKNPAPRRRLAGVEKTAEANKPKSRKPAAISPQTDENALCIVCQETWLESLPGEKWVKCVKCQNWAHNKCVSRSRRYTCDDCSDL